MSFCYPQAFLDITLRRPCSFRVRLQILLRWVCLHSWLRVHCWLDTLAATPPIYQEPMAAHPSAHTASLSPRWPGSANRSHWERWPSEPADAPGRQTSSARQEAYSDRPHAKLCRSLFYCMVTSQLNESNRVFSQFLFLLWASRAHAQSQISCCCPSLGHETLQSSHP